MSPQQQETFANAEQIVNQTYPGTVLYYKDCELEETIINQFTQYKILRNGYFLDVSSLGGGMKFNTRFLIASSRAAALYEVNPAVSKYGHCCITVDSYFKVLDVYRIGNKTQIFLLHIPEEGLQFFKQAVTSLDKQITERARKGFEEKINLPPVAALLEPSWVERTNFPVGMDGYNRFYPLEEHTVLTPEAKPLHDAIRKMTTTAVADRPDEMPEPRTDTPEPERKQGFWEKLFSKR